MAPDKSKTTVTPQWFLDFLREFRMEIQQNSANVRENNASINRQDNIDRNPRLAPNNGSRQVFITLPAASIGQTKTFGQPSARVASNSTVSRRSLVNTSNSVRDSAQPVPRVISIQRTNNSRVCWFHRNFGPASINCLPPCSFTEMQSSATQPHHQVPGLNSAVTEVQPSKVTDSTTVNPIQSLRIPLERPSPSISSVCTAATITTSSPNQSAESDFIDWNTLAEEKTVLDLSESSSDTDSGESQAKK